MTSSEEHQNLSHKKIASPTLASSPYRNQSIPSQLVHKPTVESLLARVLCKININAVRSLFSFIGTGEPTPFNIPTKHQVFSRIQSNLDYFCANYAAMTAVVLFCVMIYHPFLLLVSVSIGCGWYLVLNTSNKQEVFTVMNKEFGPREQTLIMTAVSLVFFVLFMIPMCLETIFFSALICTFHASLRETALRNEPQHFRTKGGNDSEDNV